VQRGVSGWKQAVSYGPSHWYGNDNTKWFKRIAISKMILYEFIFYKAYLIAINIFKEKEFPWTFGSVMVNLCIVIPIITLLALAQYLALPGKINTYDNYHGYFAIGTLLIIFIYVKQNNKYLNIIDQCKRLTSRKKSY
jgi:hypothetical protein